MISVDTAIGRGKWLFQYPWRIWWTLVILYFVPPFIYSQSENSILSTVLLAYYGNSLLYALMDAKFWEFIFENPASKLGFIIILCSFILNIVLYFSSYNKWKQWAFENVDDPKAFVREAIRQHFYLTSKELDHLRRTEIVHAPL